MSSHASGVPKKNAAGSLKESSAMETVGVIGLGKMGKPIAYHMLKAGYRVVVHNRSQAAVEELVAAGAAKANTPREVATQCGFVITSLPDAPTVEAVCLAPNGIRDGALRDTVFIDTSTNHPETSRRIASLLGERGMHALDAPVSGGEPGAIAGTLSVMVGGDEPVFRRAIPILERFGQTITYMGPPGSGQLTKLANQIIVALNYAAMGEGLVLGAKAGLDPEKLLRVFLGGQAQSRCLELKGEKVINGNYEPGGRLQLHMKDLQYALDTAKSYGVPLLFTSLVQQCFEATKAAGRGDWDHSAVITLLEDLAGTKIRKR
jgi:2-hydroxy-3-oxopropionate reductase